MAGEGAGKSAGEIRGAGGSAGKGAVPYSFPRRTPLAAPLPALPPASRISPALFPAPSPAIFWVSPFLHSVAGQPGRNSKEFLRHATPLILWHFGSICFASMGGIFGGFGGFFLGFWLLSWASWVSGLWPLASLLASGSAGFCLPFLAPHSNADQNLETE